MSDIEEVTAAHDGAPDQTTLQLAMFMQARDVRHEGVAIDGVFHPTWNELDAQFGQAEYLRDAAAMLGAVAALGFARRPAAPKREGDDPAIVAMAHAAMLHEGYTAEQIEAAEREQDHTQCEREMMHGCQLDKDGRSQHPVSDQLDIYAEVAGVMLEALAALSQQGAATEVAPMSEWSCSRCGSKRWVGWGAWGKVACVPCGAVSDPSTGANY